MRAIEKLDRLRSTMAVNVLKHKSNKEVDKKCLSLPVLLSACDSLFCVFFSLYLSESLQMQKVCSDVLKLGHGRRICELVEGRSRGVFSHNPLTKLKLI